MTDRWVPPGDLKKLPRDLVTKEHGDDQRIHPLDPPHIQKYLMRERAKKMFSEARVVDVMSAFLKTLRNKLLADSERRRILDQEIVDIQMGAILANAARRHQYMDLHHLWYTKKDAADAQLRLGAAPPDHMRPPHLRRLRLEFSMLDWPERIHDILRTIGIDLREIVEEVENAKKAKESRDDFERAVAAAAGSD